MANFGELEAEFRARFGHRLVANRPGCTRGQPQGLRPLSRDTFINAWTPAMEKDFGKLKIPNVDWVHGGMLYLPDGLLKDIVKEVRKEIRQKTSAEWTWDDYKKAVEETSVDFDALEAQFGDAFGLRLRRNRLGCTEGKPRDLPSLNRDSFVDAWMPAMESDFARLLIPENEWVYAGMLYLPEGSLKDIIKKAKNVIRAQTEAEWTWADYQTAVVESIGQSRLILPDTSSLRLRDARAYIQYIGMFALALTYGPSLIRGVTRLSGSGGAGMAAASVASASAAFAATSEPFVQSTGGFFSSALHFVGRNIGAAGTAVVGVGVNFFRSFYRR